ncbi:MAG: divalent-cation tolerance protein CutA [Chloroflexi bacterium]|nr:divalent-cation tolerance protein CutA [Chloroflexota bacterium]MBU1750595.1 divalent-cation tolerance protein CutA [Chloroflexota bacterium]
MNTHMVVLVTAGSLDEAVSIGRAVVEERLAACANVVPGVRSIYRWQGTVHDDPEVLLVIKTRADRFDQLAHRVQELHSYDVPEIIALPLATGSSRYLAWLNEATAEPS